MSSRRSQTFATLRKIWKLTDIFFTQDLSTPSELTQRPIALRFPFIFYYGHLSAFTSRVLHKNGLLKENHVFDKMFERGMDPDVDTGDCHACSEDLKEWPEKEAIDKYKGMIRKVVENAINDWTSSSVWLNVIMEHEAMHLETLWYMMAQVDERERRFVVNNDRDDGVGKYGMGMEKFEEMVKIGKGVGVVGRKRDDSNDRFGWDNEFGDEAVHLNVGEFFVGKFPVTVGQYAQFINHGGYENETLWREDWCWVVKEKIKAPASWRWDNGSWMIVTAEELWSLKAAAAWPVFVCLAEAKAYARWKGARLLTEPEWDYVAWGSPTQGENCERKYPWGNEDAISGYHGNFGFVNRRQIDVDTYPKGASAWGVMDLIGNGWELTETVFSELPGFRPQEDYLEYSVDFFDGKHFVLKGGSWATHPTLLRRSFRNFYQARYPYLFGKFRIVYDCADQVSS